MRIAMIDPSLFTLPYDQALANALVAAGHQVILYGRKPGPDDNSTQGAALHQIFYRVTTRRPFATLPGPLRLAAKGMDHAWSMRRLLQHLRQDKPDIIHFQWLALPPIDRIWLSALRRIAPLVLTMHDTNPFNGDPSSRLQALGVFGCVARFDGVIVHTAQGHARLLARNVAAERLAILPHGPLQITYNSAMEDTMQGNLIFMLFGKIKPYKGIDLAIEAFAQLPAALRAQARLRVVGKAYMDLAPLQALAKARGIAEQVSIEPRFVDDDEISNLFGANTVAVFPYREIDSSGVLPLALACGRPVIASAIGGFAETLTDGVQGHLVPAGDVAALTAALAHIVQDRVFAATCARNAHALSRGSVQWDSIAQQTAALYEDVRYARTHQRATAAAFAG